jgi:hypothetical protein
MALEAHPFTSFNKPGSNGTQTLIGNWVEERVLEESTSYSRYKVRLGMHTIRLAILRQVRLAIGQRSLNTCTMLSLLPVQSWGQSLHLKRQG